MSDSRTFADGFSFKRSEKAPDFVIGTVSIKIEDAVKFMKEHNKNGWVNLAVKQARSGNYYLELDKFEPKAKQQAAPTAQHEETTDLPF